MADTFTSLLRLVLQETGGNQNVWGDVNNASAIDLLEDAIAGRLDLDVTPATDPVTLTSLNGAADQARNMIIAVTGNPGGTRSIIVPSTDKLYIFSNETSPAFDVTFKTALGSGIVVSGGTRIAAYVDATADDVVLIGAAPTASETQAGLAEIATQAETNTGTDDARIVSPLKLANATSLLQATETQKGALEIATQAETDLGTDDVRALTPLKLENRAASEILTGIIELATQAEVLARVDAVRAVTPATLFGSGGSEEKTADETTSLDVVLSDDADLVITGVVAGTYIYECLFYFFADVDIAMGIQWRLNYTGTVTRSQHNFHTRQNAIQSQNVGTSGVNTTDLIGNIRISSADKDFVLMHGTMVVSDGGTFSLQWAQNASNANNLTVADSSYLMLNRIL